MRRLLFLRGGPWHPLDAQIERLRSWLPAAWRIDTAFGATAFERLDDADLFVAAGMHWPALDEPLPDLAWQLAGIPPHGYTRPNEAQQEGFRRYVASGRPLLAFHGGILNFEDWPEFGRLLGFRWHTGFTGHAKVAEYPVAVATDSHPTVAGVVSYRIRDELYYNVVLPPEMPVRIHARAQFADWVEFPMVLTAEGPAGRCAGAGRTAYLANGHLMESLDPPPLRALWLNTLHWLLDE